MADRMYRTQILLEPAQHQQLTQLAQSEKRSISDIVREMLDAQLEARKQEAPTRLARRLEALRQIENHRQQILNQRRGQPLPIQPAEMIDQLRQEQDERYFVA